MNQRFARIVSLLLICACAFFSSSATKADETGNSRKEITAEDFLNSKAAQYFQEGHYEEALLEFRELEKRYPEDPLIKRYIGITLDKLGQPKQALSVYESAVLLQPKNAALRYARAHAYLGQKQYQEAAVDLEYVIKYDTSRAYRQQAERDLANVQNILNWLKRKREGKKWALSVTSGADYNTNATLESRVSPYRNQIHQSAWKFFELLNGSYEIAKSGPWFIKATYQYYQALYSDSLSQLNVFLNSPGILIGYSSSLFGKPLFLQLTHTTCHAIVKDDYYSTSFIQSFSVSYAPARRSRIVLSERCLFSSYEKEGYDPDITSQDGSENLSGITHYFYFDRARNFYHMLTLESQRNNTQGADYIRNAFAVQTGFHFPLLFRFEGDLNFKFRESSFPKFSPIGLQPERSRDEEYTFETRLSRKLTDHLTINGTYKLITNDSQYDLYTYTNHIGGFSLSCSY